MAFVSGVNQKVALDATKVIGMGNWKMSGITVDLLESTSFGDTAKKFMTGLVDWGTVTFGGLYDVSNTGGQSTLISACLNNSKIANLRCYVNSVSYWVPNISHSTDGSDAGVYIQSFNIGADKSGLATIEFTGKFTGPVVFQ